MNRDEWVLAPEHRPRPELCGRHGAGRHSTTVCRLRAAAKANHREARCGELTSALHDGALPLPPKQSLHVKMICVINYSLGPPPGPTRAAAVDGSSTSRPTFTGLSLVARAPFCTRAIASPR